MLYRRFESRLGGRDISFMRLTTEDAVLALRADPEYRDLVRDAYLGRDVLDSANRFAASAEFDEVRRLLGSRVEDATVLDVGAGTGIASIAFLRSGARRAIALEPDPSEEIGRGAIARLDAARSVEVVDAYGEAIPIPDGSVDIVYARQLLHHAEDIDQLVRECARVLRAGGVMLACREHVVANDVELEEFLASHPVHKLAGGENAFTESRYVEAFRVAGLELLQVLGPWDSVINAFPVVRTKEELTNMPRQALERRFGRLGRFVASFPGVLRVVRARLASEPGRLYSFYALKPDG